jgi:hypothetical protein
LETAPKVLEGKASTGVWEPENGGSLMAVEICSVLRSEEDVESR